MINQILILDILSLKIVFYLNGILTRGTFNFELENLRIFIVGYDPTS